MVATQDNAGPIFKVVRNQQGRHALWPARKGIPEGWTEVLGPRPEAECLQYVAGAYRSLRIQQRSRAPVMDFGLLFFGEDEGENAREKYEFVIEAARFTDRNGFAGIWLPERHFTRMGSLYPNPAVLHAALARETSQIRLRAGSVVLPLHHPIRVAEEWALVDNLSGGRVELSFAPGWNAEDFALNPGRFDQRYDLMVAGISTVERLWKGETLECQDGAGQPIRVRTYPTPVQKGLIKWMTAASSLRTFELAGELGANLLTHLFDQSVDELADKIAAYRRARGDAGLDPDSGRVAVTLHTFLGASAEDVRQHAFVPYRDYLKANLRLLEKLAQSRNFTLDIRSLPPEELDAALEWLYEKFLRQRSLLGTVDECADLVTRLGQIGVQEIACLVDFGPAPAAILGSLPHLCKLKNRFQGTGPGAAREVEAS